LNKGFVPVPILTISSRPLPGALLRPASRPDFAANKTGRKGAPLRQVVAKITTKNYQNQIAKYIDFVNRPGRTRLKLTPHSKNICLNFRKKSPKPDRKILSTSQTGKVAPG
jgi:hypothetical protein